MSVFGECYTITINFIDSGNLFVENYTSNRYSSFDLAGLGTTVVYNSLRH